MRLQLAVVVAVICSVSGAMAQGTVPPGCDVCFSGTLIQDKENFHSFSVIGGMRYDILLFRDSASGNADLYTNDTSGVSRTNYDCAPLKPGSQWEQCVYEPTSNGTYYTMVHGATGPVSYTLYVVESDTGCHSGSPGGYPYCSASCICGWELGDCDSNSQCAIGLTCVQNVGAEYGWPSDVDVCRGG